MPTVLTQARPPITTLDRVATYDPRLDPDEQTHPLDILATNADLLQKLDTAECSVVIQKRKLDETVASFRSKKSKKIVLTDDTQTVLRLAVKTHLWPTIKFSKGDAAQLNAALLVTRASGLPNKFDEAGRPTEEGRLFAERNMKAINDLLNSHRNYVQGTLKTAMFAYMKKKNLDKPPPVDAFLKILTRDPSLDEDLFEWYWDTFVYKATGNQKIWSHQHRYYGLLSSYGPPTKIKSRPYITSATEAFAVLIVDNCEHKWPLLFKAEQESQGKIVYYKEEVKEKKAGFLYVNTKKHPEWVGKYTEPEIGQVEDGGWTNQGLKRYIELRAMAEEGRKKPTTPALEQKILNKLRAKYGIEGDSYEEYMQRKRKGKGKELEANEALDDLYMDDDFELFPV